MEVFDAARLPREAADAAHFTGRATLTRMTGVSDRPVVNVYRVAFEMKARTAWHTHGGIQLLVVTEGRCRLQKWGEPVLRMDAGGIACIASGEKHWHGADSDSSMTHIAVNVDAKTTWLEMVSDEEYGG